VRSERRALAIDERLRAKLEWRSTEQLVVELDRLEATLDDPATRRTEATTEARVVAERQLCEACRALQTSTAGRRDQARLEAIHAHAAARIDTLRAEEQAARAAAPEPADRERAAAIERILEERRWLSVKAAITAEPRYLTEVLGRRPEGPRARLEWERAVDTLERHRQLMGVRDPDQPLGREPQDRGERARWRVAHRELEAMSAKLVESERARERVRVAGLGIER